MSNPPSYTAAKQNAPRNPCGNWPFLTNLVPRQMSFSLRSTRAGGAAKRCVPVSPRNAPFDPHALTNCARQPPSASPPGSFPWTAAIKGQPPLMKVPPPPSSSPDVLPRVNSATEPKHRRTGGWYGRFGSADRRIASSCFSFRSVCLLLIRDSSSRVG